MMLSFIILLVTLAILITVSALIIGVGGVAFTVVFADAIVFALIIWLIVKCVSKKKK